MNDCSGVFAIGSRLELYQLPLDECSICIRSSLQAVTVEHNLIKPHQLQQQHRAASPGRVLQTSHLLSLYPMCGRYLDVYMQLAGRHLAVSNACNTLNRPRKRSSPHLFTTWVLAPSVGSSRCTLKIKGNPHFGPSNPKFFLASQGGRSQGTGCAGLDQPPEPQIGPPPPRRT